MSTKETLLYGLDLVQRVTMENYILWSREFQCWECARCRQRHILPSKVAHTEDCIVGQAFREVEAARIYVTKLVGE